MSSFLPKDYKAPSTGGGYMKLVDGENKFRILSKPLLGWEDWNDVNGKKTPVRYDMDNKPKVPLDPSKPIKHFWSMIVWNYTDEAIQILHVTQASIRKSIETLCADEDWGDPYFYDMKIIKTGKAMDTEYVVNPLPHKPLAPAIKKLFEEKPCCLHYLLTGDDPFSCAKEEATAGIFDKSAPSSDVKEEAVSPFITGDQLNELLVTIGDDEEYKNKIVGHYKIKGLADLPADQYLLVYQRACNHAKQGKEATLF